ncbi:MAG: cysteine hydrolase family protein [Acidimicrobiia bacterium]
MTYIESEPYPWPYDGDLSASRIAFLWCGAQHYWRERTVDSDSALVAAAKVAVACSVTIAMRHECVPGSRMARCMPVERSSEAELVPEAASSSIVLSTAGLNGFYQSRLDAELRARGIDRLVIGGLGLEGPVHSTMRSANDRGYECLVLTDGCAPQVADLMHASFHTIAMSGGIFGAFAPASAVLDALTIQSSGGSS